MKKKRGQVAVFVIVAIVIIVIIGGVVFFINKGEGFGSSLDIDPVKNYIDQCLQEASKNSVYFVGLQGGYYNKQVDSRDYFGKTIPYYWSDETDYVPDLTTVQNEISKYIKDNVEYCVNNFEIFDESSFEFELGEINVDSKLSEGELQVDVNYPVVIKKEGKTEEFEKFESVVITNFKILYDSANLIIEEQKKDHESIPLSYLGTISKEKGFEFETINLGEGEIIYTLIFDKDRDNPLIYAFMNKYNWEETALN